MKLGSASDYGAMGRRIDLSWWTHDYFSFQPVLHDWYNNTVVCAILSAINRKE